LSATRQSYELTSVSIEVIRGPSSEDDQENIMNEHDNTVDTPDNDAEVQEQHRHAEADTEGHSHHHKNFADAEDDDTEGHIFVEDPESQDRR